MNMKHCFIHLKGVSEELESTLFSNNIYSWDDLIEHISQDVTTNILHKNSFSISNEDKEELSSDIQLLNSCNTTSYQVKKQEPIIPSKFHNDIINQIQESKEALEKKNWNYFTKKLLSKYHYKLLPLTNSTAYVDIETTGLSREYHYITTIGIYDGKSSHIYVRGIDLEDAFLELEKYDVIVTFNGKQFDMPFIEHTCNKKFECVHLDLRFMLKELGLSGGLKRIERELGLQRDEEVAQIDGFFAVELWKRYQRGDDNALELLKKYNIEDIENLEVLLYWYLSQKEYILNN
ncbi:MAG: ribonuclease H-like domain-containing protein [Candidatus Nanoarchaeia archaeon]